MIDRLVHHAEVASPKRDSSRLKDRDLGRLHDDAAMAGAAVWRHMTFDISPQRCAPHAKRRSSIYQLWRLL